MKLYILSLFIIIGITPYSFPMEHESSSEEISESYLDLLPDETLLGVFSQIVPICSNQKETFATIVKAQLIEKRCLSLINSDTGIKMLNRQLARKYETSLDLYALLNCTQQNKQAFQFSKTVFCCAALHHNRLNRCFEEDELPWMQLEKDAYCTALAKSCQLIQKESITTFKKITADFSTFKDAELAKAEVSTYPEAWQPYTITAQLLYLCDNVDNVVKESLKNKFLSERLHNYVKKSGDVKNMFAQTFVWQPRHLIIPKDFQENKDSVKDGYLELSKKLYKFTSS